MFGYVELSIGTVVFGGPESTELIAVAEPLPTFRSRSLRRNCSPGSIAPSSSPISVRGRGSWARTGPVAGVAFETTSA